MRLDYTPTSEQKNAKPEIQIWRFDKT